MRRFDEKAEAEKLEKEALEKQEAQYKKAEIKADRDFSAVKAELQHDMARMDKALSLSGQDRASAARSERIQQKRERTRQSLLLLDNERQEEADRKKREEAVATKEQLEKARKLPPGSLMRAITECDETVAMTVIQHPSFCEAHTRDGRGCTTLHCAAERGLTNVCKSLLMMPTFRDAGIRDNAGWSALHRAAKNGHSMTAKCLASYPELTDPKVATGRDGFTALHCAAIHGFSATVKVLLDHPKFFEINAVDNWGRTALHCAAEYGHHDVVKLLMEDKRFTAHNARTKWGVCAGDIATGKAKDVLSGKRRESNADDLGRNDFGRQSFDFGNMADTGISLSSLM